MTAALTRTGAGGGGADTTCDSGSDAQPPRRQSALQSERSGANDFTQWGGGEAGDMFFIVRSRLWIHRPVRRETPKPVGPSPATAPPTATARPRETKTARKKFRAVCLSEKYSPRAQRQEPSMNTKPSPR